MVRSREKNRQIKWKIKIEIKGSNKTYFKQFILRFLDKNLNAI